MAGELKAGAARVDLTPPNDLQASLGGYGERMSRPAEGVHDRVFAKALVVGIPGEATAELGLKIKAEAIKATDARRVAVGGLADEWISYILSEGSVRPGRLLTTPLSPTHAPCV